MKTANNAPLFHEKHAKLAQKRKNAALNGGTAHTLELQESMPPQRHSRSGRRRAPATPRTQTRRVRPRGRRRRPALRAPRPLGALSSADGATARRGSAARADRRTRRRTAHQNAGAAPITDCRPARTPRSGHCMCASSRCSDRHGCTFWLSRQLCTHRIGCNADTPGIPALSCYHLQLHQIEIRRTEYGTCRRL